MRGGFVLVVFFVCSILSYAQQQSEFRGVWIATVDNIDWPKRGAIQFRQPEKGIHTPAGFAQKKWHERRNCTGAPGHRRVLSFAL
jgi:hypothetical protein